MLCFVWYGMRNIETNTKAFRQQYFNENMNKINGIYNVSGRNGKYFLQENHMFMFLC